MSTWLIRSSLARLVIAAFLSNSRWKSQGLSTYIAQRALPGVQSVAGPIAAALLDRALRELASGKLSTQSPPFECLRGLYAWLTARVSPPSRTPEVQVASLDPAVHWYRGIQQGEPEFRIMLDAFEYLDSETGAGDRMFGRLFWQTLRMRVLFYRHVVQRPMTPGLQWFTRTYARLSAARQPLELQTFVNGACSLSGPGLRSLEVRIVPTPTMSSLASTVDELDRAFKLRNIPEAGIVFHFSRTRGQDAEQGIPEPWGRMTYEDPGPTQIHPDTGSASITLNNGARQWHWQIYCSLSRSCSRECGASISAQTNWACLFG